MLSGSEFFHVSTVKSTMQVLCKFVLASAKKETSVPNTAEIVSGLLRR